jgi:hypothetical protein
MCQNEFFQSSGTKNETHVEVKDENNIFAIKLFSLRVSFHGWILVP